MDNYQEIKQIGEGTYGKVYKALDNNKPIAIKKIEIDKKTGFPFTTIREIKMMKKLTHPNIVKLANVYIENDYMYIVMEYFPFDLSALIARIKLSDEQIKSFSYQLIEAVRYIHSFDLVHRDIKSSNILIDKDGVLKLADFGLTTTIKHAQKRNEMSKGNNAQMDVKKLDNAENKNICVKEKQFSHKFNNAMTNRVCTLYYRSPELLLGSCNYDAKVDSWSIGCVILEMKLGKILFKGKDEIDQVHVVLSKLGCPKEEYRWSHMFNVNAYKKNDNWNTVLKQNFGFCFNAEMLSFVGEFLKLSPRERISPRNALCLSILKGYSEKRIKIELDDVHDFYVREKKKKSSMPGF